MRNFFNEQRGITDATLNEFNVDLEENKAHFMYPTGIKTRIHHVDDGKREFLFEKGKPVSLLESPKPMDPGKYAFLVEGETDAMRLWQELEPKIPVCGIPGIETWRDEFDQQLEGYDRVWVILDNDKDYNVSA